MDIDTTKYDKIRKVSHTNGMYFKPWNKEVIYLTEPVQKYLLDFYCKISTDFTCCNYKTKAPRSSFYMKQQWINLLCYLTEVLSSYISYFQDPHMVWNITGQNQLHHHLVILGECQPLKATELWCHHPPGQIHFHLSECYFLLFIQSLVAGRYFSCSVSTML
jgi:hypothetical protein